MIADEKQDDAPQDTFLNTAARAVGSTLGKLAAKAGLAHPEEKPRVSPPLGNVPKKKKRAVGVAKLVRRPAAKTKKATPKKVVRVAKKAKR